MAVPATAIEFQLSLLLLASLVGFFISARFRQSGVVGSILVGILLGPSVFGLIPYSETVQALATIGAIFLLFTVGLDTKLEDLWDRRAAILAGAGVILPWLGGFLLSLLFGFTSSSAFFIGTALTATSVAITVQVLGDMGKLQKPEAKILLSAAIIDDVLGLFALSIAQQVTGESISFIGLAWKGLLALAFIAAGLFAGKMFFSRKISDLHDWAMVHRNYEYVPFIASIFLAFFYSVLAEVAGLSAIVGAFIAGISLEHLEIGNHKEGAKYFEIIFGNLFFISLGVLVNLREAFNLSSLLFLIALTIVALVTKFIAGFLSALFFRFPRKEALVIGVGMAPRGEIAMIIGLVGLGAGLLSQSVFSSIVLMGVLTALVAPILITRIYDQREGKQRVKIY
jgi:Kef-type K+ transport system membrane component KefB